MYELNADAGARPPHPRLLLCCTAARRPPPPPLPPHYCCCCYPDSCAPQPSTSGPVGPRVSSFDGRMPMRL